jgi:hypothetical protein
MWGFGRGSKTRARKNRGQQERLRRQSPHADEKRARIWKSTQEDPYVVLPWYQNWRKLYRRLNIPPNPPSFKCVRPAPARANHSSQTQPMSKSAFLAIYYSGLENASYFCGTSIHRIRRYLGKKVDGKIPPKASWLFSGLEQFHENGLPCELPAAKHDELEDIPGLREL